MIKQVVNGQLVAVAGNGVSQLDDLDDVVTTGATNGDILRYDTSTQKWHGMHGGGHDILDGSGVTMNNEPKLQFLSADVTDDSTNGKTIVEPKTMTGATSSAAGAKGFVPTPAAGDEDKCLKGDGTWGTVVALPEGGSAPQVLTKQSSTDGDADWDYVSEPMTWEQYSQLSQAEQMDGRLRTVTNRTAAPIDASGQAAIDTEGIVTTAGGTTNTQALLDGISDKSVFHVVATSTGSKTYAEHLSSLLSALNALTTDQKMRCFLRNGNNMFTLGNMSSGTFTNVSTTNAAQTFTVARLSSSDTAIYTQTKIKSDGTTTFSDLSGTSEDTTFELVY